MNLSKMITKRKSVRRYKQNPLPTDVLDQIEQKMNTLKPLYPQIRVMGVIVNQEQVRFYFPWKAPHLIAIFSEEKDGYGENVGFLYQQMDLYLQSRGIGSCWMGLGKIRDKEFINRYAEEGLKFVILLAFGYPDGDATRTNLAQFKRKDPREIADFADPVLEPARLAPSSTNSQPWYFVHENGRIHAFCSKAGILRHAMLGTMNRIDMGIALAHLYVTNPDCFEFEKVTPLPYLDGYGYIGTVCL